MILLIGAVSIALAGEMTGLEKQAEKEIEPVEDLMRLGIDYHHKGVEGNKEAVKKAEKIFKDVLALNPDHVEALAWYGSILTMKGRDAIFPISKLMHVHRGTKKMDEAIEKSPDNVTVRMVRVGNSLGLPEFFGRLDLAISDSEYLLKLKERDATSVPDELLPQIYLNLGLAHKKKQNKEQAEKYLKKVIEIAPESKEAEVAKKLLL
ncbi:TPA: hypothetical protein DCX15_01710 [bacterium]|nr:hypothetical protein [bacterium]